MRADGKESLGRAEIPTGQDECDAIGWVTQGVGNPNQSRRNLEVFLSLCAAELRGNVVGFPFQGVEDVHSWHNKTRVLKNVRLLRQFWEHVELGFWIVYSVSFGSLRFQNLINPSTLGQMRH